MSGIKKFTKQLYHVIPFKRGLFTMIRAFFIPPEKIFKHLHFKGVFRVRYHSKKVFCLIHHGRVEENEIFWKGLENGWEGCSIELWIKLSKRSNVIYDIGANSGLYGICSKYFNPNAIVHCFEPIPEACRIIRENTSINNLEINVHEFAISNYNGNATIYLREGTNFAYSVTLNKNTLNSTINASPLEVKTYTISNLINENKVPAPDLVKLDIERHEFEALQGMKEVIISMHPDFLIEILDEEQASKVQTIFEEFDYLYFNINDAAKTIRQTKQIEKSDHWNYLVCKQSTANELGLINHA